MAHTREPVGEVVGGLTEVVYDVPDEYWDERVVGLAENPSAEDVLSGLNLTLTNHGTSVEFEPPLLGSVERSQMIYRPVKL
jgi:hypothetical protein